MPFLRNDFKEGDPVRVTASAKQQRRLANILMDLKVLGGRLERNFTADGKGWLLVIDGSTDLEPPTADPTKSPLPPGYNPPFLPNSSEAYQYQVCQLDDEKNAVWDWVRAHA